MSESSSDVLLPNPICCGGLFSRFAVNPLMGSLLIALIISPNSFRAEMSRSDVPWTRKWSESSMDQQVDGPAIEKPTPQKLLADTPARSMRPICIRGEALTRRCISRLISGCVCKSNIGPKPIEVGSKFVVKKSTFAD